VAEEPQDESDLVERARRGDAEAFGRLVRAYQGIALRTAYVITADSADAEDAAQVAFTKAYFALRRFRRGAPFRPWLLRIVANEARNRRRGEGRRAGLALRAEVEAAVAAAAPSPETSVIAGERRATLLAAVNELRAEERDVVALRYFLDLGEDETAAALGIPRGTVKSRLARALVKLQERVEEPA
jgi:RNA polymerase sigma-70 factor (ECF subfamily)